MKKTKIFLAMMISSLLIGCNQVQESANKAVAQVEKDIVGQATPDRIPIPDSKAVPEQTLVPDVAPIPEPTPVPEQKQVPKTIPVPESTPNISNTNNNNIGESKAKEIALSKVPNGVIIECSFDYDDYIPNYDISIIDNTYEYDFEINASDGSILARDKEYIDRYDD